MTTAIIDGDVVAYMACESRYLGTIDKILKGVGLDKAGITDIGEELPPVESMRLVTLEPVLFTPEEDEAYFKKAWMRFQDITLSISEFCFADRYLMSVKGDGCFRNDIYPEYKANRNKSPDKRNYFVPRLRQKAVETGMAVPAHGMEADDHIRMWSEECMAKDEPYVICSVDKDLKCIPGRHLNIKKNEFTEVSKEYATRFYYEQLLQGDPTDNIKGIPKVGPVKAKAFLAECNTEAEYQKTVVEAYQAAFGEDWRKELILNGRLIYLLKHKDDIFHIENWAMPTLDADNKAMWEFPAAQPVIPKEPTNKTVQLFVPEPNFAPDPAVPLPTFNPNWGKKKNASP